MVQKATATTKGMQQGKSQFNLGAALAAHANDETKYTEEFSSLPAGINGGIAHLITATIGTFKPGTPNAGGKFIRMAGRICEPLVCHEVVKGWVDDGTKDGKVQILEERDVRVKGRQTSIVLPLCDTPKKGKQEAKTADENVALACNKVREICGPNSLDGIADENDFEARLKELAESGSYFRFGTNASDPNREYPNHRAFEKWYSNQGLEDYTPPEGGQVVEAATQVHTNGTATQAAPAAAQDAGQDQGTENDDLNELASVANDDDNEGQIAAQERLQEIATGLDINIEEVDGDWIAVVAAIEEKQGGGQESEPEPEPEDETPVLKGIYLYQLKDGRTGKPKTDAKKRPLKPIEVEVLTINKGKKTCTVMNNVDRKTRIADVPWDELKAK